MKKLVLGAVVGGIVAQIWGMVSWMGLGWHMADFKPFADPDAVADAVRAQNQGTGLYMLPNWDPSIHTDEEKMNEWNSKSEAGPFVFMSVQANGVKPGMGPMMAIGFGINVLVAFLLVWLLGQTSLTSPFQQALFVGVAGAAGAMFPHLSNWNWWHFPLGYCLVGVVDLFITWFLAGFAISKLSG